MLSLYYKRHSESNASVKGSHTSGVILKQNMSEIFCPLHFSLALGYRLVKVRFVVFGWMTHYQPCPSPSDVEHLLSF
jgi:hypothetical protein